MKSSRYPKRPSTPAAATRVVKTRRWIRSSELEIGMYVSELDKPWSDTRFLFQGFVVDSPAVLREICRSCETVQIETEKLAHVPVSSPRRLCGAFGRRRGGRL